MYQLLQHLRLAKQQQSEIWSSCFSQVIKEKLDKIKGSQGFACLTDEINDISNVQNLLNFVRYCDFEKSKTANNCAHICNLLVQFETTSADALSIF